ncbi:mamu class II histocompatibility antigen, DR alpha chain [Etheostoma spectabile]|uniref:mamu class II histocompatibility antigen, DR alpha chain n=1 Tax=Etheostoma spectabile TaxID=54343 RepID=UPI0013AE98E4|nr:mamu class II histocompatibility antigen, DR alpha chain-like [Etheostoma spectabile]XP_032364726.1 mamu class II histocompatibility antigen, DR alpha chain-like [Etheostoma spectabile]
MKMMMVLVLSGLFCVSAAVLHEDLSITGCSDSDGEEMYSVDGEEVWYADFIHQRGVEPQPSFIDHISYPGAYEGAVAHQQVCRSSLKADLHNYKNPPLQLDPPSSPMVYTKEDLVLGEKNDLICYVTGFYPAPVVFSWTRNGDNVTTATSTNVPYPNKDGSFNQFSRLEFTPQPGDLYSCTVHHVALDRPLTRIWDVEKTGPGVGPAVFCGLGLTVGLLGVAAGTFFLIKGNECS